MIAWLPRGILQISPDEVDPCDEADVYCAHGQPWRGLECLELALGAIGTIRVGEYAVTLDEVKLREKIAAIERAFPLWREMQSRHQQARRVRRLQAFFAVSMAAGFLLAGAMVWR